MKICAHCGHSARRAVTRGTLTLCNPNFGLDCLELVHRFQHPTPCSAPICVASVASLKRRENNQVIEDR